jgi:hypothetical protein
MPLRYLQHRMSRLFATALACTLAAGTAYAAERVDCRVVDYGTPDAQRVDKFVADFTRPTAPNSLLSSAHKRTQILDERLRGATLSLADKIAVLQKLSPREDPTDEHKELRMERLILSIDPKDLPQFKLALEYDGDYKDIEEYLFHDIDREAYRNRILEHFRKAPRQGGVKVLSDVDDTLYANLLDRRYPPKTLYPGVLAFYDALKREPFNALSTPVTFLSARPNPIAGKLEEDSLQKLMALTGGKLCPSALSGRTRSSVAGTLQSVLRDKLDVSLHDLVPDGKEQEIGRVKFRNFLKFADIYPEYRHIFVGDSGQADALTARLMLGGPAQVITTFIHDITRSSRTFNALRADERITRASANGRGIIVFRNYIDAAIIAHVHSKTLGDLITAEQLAGITREALTAFRAIAFAAESPAVTRLRHEYRQDAEEAYRLLTTTSRTSSPEVAAIRGLLDQGL